MDINESFLKAITLSTLAYSKYGPRSNKKIESIHGFIAKTLAEYFPESSGYKIESLGYSGNEGSLKTGLGDTKNVDIKISKNNIDIACVMVKYICSSYGKNAKNYAENMTGETASIHHIKNEAGRKILVWQLIVMPEYMPIYDKDRKIIKIETVTNKEIARYSAIRNYRNSIDKPDVLSLHMVNMGNRHFLEDCKKNSKVVDISSDDFVNSLNIEYSNLENYNTKEHPILSETFNDSLQKFIKKCKKNSLLANIVKNTSTKKNIA